MPEDFDSVLARHGEDLIELVLCSWETYNGVRHSHLATLRDRWEYFIAKTDEALAAAERAKQPVVNRQTKNGTTNN